MHQQLMRDFLSLRDAQRRQVQQELNVTFEKGHHESDKEFATRVLTEIDNQGKLRNLEQLLNS